MASPESPLVELNGVGRRYVRKTGAPVLALRDVSLCFRAGEFVCITGPSGSGKSTLMHILGCLDTPDSGSYRFAGRELRKLGPDAHAWLRRNAFGFVFQNYHLLESATACENVELPATYAGLAPSARRARALELLAGLGLENRARHRPAALSGGEQQRVSIARALMNGAQLLLADEPTGALDSRNGEEVLRHLERLTEAGRTVILISHDPEVAARADRRIELRDGRVVADTGPSPRSGVGGEPAEPLKVKERNAIGAAGRLADAARAGAASLRANLLRTRRMRAALTVLSMVLGVWAVVSMLSIAEGVYRSTVSQVGQLGANRLQVLPGLRDNEQPVRPGLEDARAIVRSVGNVESVLPVLERRLTVRYGDRNRQTTVAGYVAIAAPDAAGAAPPMQRGRFIRPENNRNRDQVAVIGWGVGDDLFPSDVDPVGQYVLLGNLPFRVQGVLGGREIHADAPAWLTQRQERRVVVPYSAAAALLFGTDSPDALEITVRDPLRMEATERAVRTLLIRRHGGEGFVLGYSGGRVAQVREIRAVLWLGLGSLGGIALLAGGMGVMAIMLMAVSERTREIGIRMAVGARRRDITRQFVIEAVALSAVGGVLGFAVSLASNPLVESFGIPTAFSGWILLAALLSAAGTGLVFGIAPARRASRLDPVAALAVRG